MRLVATLADLFVPYAAHHGMQMTFRVDPGTPGLTTCGRSLHWLLGNLLHNAVQHSQASMVVVLVAPIDAARATAGIQFVVIDDGVGLDATTQQTLRSMLCGQRAPDRSGLGSVARLAQALGAHVSLDSEPADGTTVTVNVPVKDCGLVGPALP